MNSDVNEEKRIELVNYYLKVKETILNTNKIQKELTQQLLDENKGIVIENFESGKTPKETAYQLAKYFNYYKEIKKYLLSRTGIHEETILQLAKKYKQRFIDYIEEGKTVEEVKHELWLIERLGDG